LGGEIYRRKRETSKRSGDAKFDELANTTKPKKTEPMGIFFRETPHSLTVL